MLILVVDDDALSRELLTVLLEAEGYTVQVAESGEAAVAGIAASQFASEAMPEVVLTDLRMPGLSGSALAGALRPKLSSRTLLVAMSGSLPAVSALEGFAGFLMKPFQVSEMEALVRNAADAALAMPREEQSLLETSRANNQVAAQDQAQYAAPDGIPEINAPGALEMLDEPDVLDKGIYQKMCELMPAEQLVQMYELCVGDARKRIARMSTSAALGDDARYRSEAHTVKGGCGMMGAKQLHELAAAAERNGITQGHDVSGTSCVTVTLLQMSAACDRLERILGEREDERGEQRTQERTRE